jgi:hypothetical protein
MTPESFKGNKDIIHVESIYKQIRMTHYDFFGGVTLKLSVITPLIQHVIKECLTLGLFDRVSKSSSFPHSYVATKKGMRLDTKDIFPYNLVMTLSDLQHSTRRYNSAEQPKPSASSSSFQSSSSSSSRENGNGVNSAIEIGIGIGTQSSSPVDLNGRRLSSRLMVDKSREGDRETDRERDTKGLKEGSRERDRLVGANVSSFDSGMTTAKEDMDMDMEEDVVTEIVWADQDPGEEQRPLAPERNRLAEKGDKLKNKKDSNHGAAIGKSSDDPRDKNVILSMSSDPSKKSWPTFITLGSVVVERSPYSHLCGALGCRIIFEAIRVSSLLLLPSLFLSLNFSVSTLYSYLDIILSCSI